MRTSSDLTRSLVDQICTRPVYWTKAINFEQKPTHILDFGPGHASGVGSLTHRVLDGTGVQIILAGTNDLPLSNVAVLQTKAHLFSCTNESLRFAPNWSLEYKPRLVRSSSRLIVDTKFSRLLCRPPLMVAGMTPCTVDGDFVQAIIKAGYHVELAGGGHYNEASLRSKISNIVANVAEGESISLNILYLNQRQWGFQYPLVQVLRREGVPVGGVTVAAGVPNVESATEIVKNLQEAGIRHVSFKPGSVEAIHTVVAIARANLSMPIILQWTGGRAGGHHSYEDFHQPILETYSLIRSVSNLILVGGSGFGDGDDSFPYLSGEWSTAWEYPPMPFDGILLGSRLLVAKEAKTSNGCKEIISSAKGTLNEIDWEKSYREPVGGVVTVRSELGEPIHKMATRGVLLWKELDETLFHLPREKRLEFLKSKRNYLIDRLNRDHQRPWFGPNGASVEDLTYEAVVERMIQLMFNTKKSQWIDESYMTIVADFITRIEERFSTVTHQSFFDNIAFSETPIKTFKQLLFDHYPEACTRLVNSEDQKFFLRICQQPGRKPVPFIPVLDENFETWFKKDSLWQSEDVDSLIDGDPQRTCILQGPVAVKYSNRINEPVKDILDGINSRYIDLILEKFYHNDLKNVNQIEWFGGDMDFKEVLDENLSYSVPDGKSLFAVSNLDSGNWQWFIDSVLPSQKNWLYALIQSRTVFEGHKIVVNSLKDLLYPHHGYQYELCVNRSQIESLKMIDSHGNYLLELALIEPKLICMRIFNGAKNHLSFYYRYNPCAGDALIHKVNNMPDNDTLEIRVKKFYWNTWFATEDDIKDCTSFNDVWEADPQTAIFKTEAIVDRKSMANFCRIVGNCSELYTDIGQSCLTAPMDYAIVVAWKAVIRAIFPQKVGGNMLNLVHLSNRIVNHSPNDPLKAGDSLVTEARIAAILDGPNGRLVRVQAIAMRSGIKILSVVSEFLYRSFNRSQINSDNFERREVSLYILEIQNEQDLALLKSKKWLKWMNEENVNLGTSLIFRLDTISWPQTDHLNLYRSIKTSGTVQIRLPTKELITVAIVEYHELEGSNIIKGNAVIAYLERHGRLTEQPVLFPNDGYPLCSGVNLSVTAGTSNQMYSDCSGDHNPIHTNRLFAILAGLSPTTIVHGMWSSAAVRALIESYATGGRPLQLTDYKVAFQSPVLPGDSLETTLRHVGMTNGRKLIQIETVNSSSSVTVLNGRAEIEQPVTAYIFTGQGSQQVGMGMDLYASSSVAREIWDRADQHFLKHYGFSILNIVKSNPKEITIHFGGRKGKTIRKNYQNMSYIDSDGKRARLFVDISDSTASYTFKSPNGLLFQTQFTQPALTLMEKASFEDMRAKGLIGPNSAFAGHSLGEYAALASIGDVLLIETLCDVVFYRGMTMQTAVKRDSNGNSQYGMIAVNPSRVGGGFNEPTLKAVVKKIQLETSRLLEIVNYNVENWQYVLAGELFALDLLTNMLNAMHVRLSKEKHIIIASLDKKILEDQLNGFFEHALTMTDSKTKQSVRINLEKGYASIPLPGIDVPFHSSFLLGGVEPFRAYLSRKIEPTMVDVATLSGHYVPNLTAKAFEVSHAYVSCIFDCSKSPVIGKILNEWNQNDWLSTPAMQQKLAHTLLVELLAYQFASAVRWIETQDLLFKDFGVERFIEIGPSPVLSGMTERTLKLKYESYDDALNFHRVIWSYSTHRADIYYETEIFEEQKKNLEETKETCSVEATSSDNLNVSLITKHESSLPIQAPNILRKIPMGPEELIQILVACKLKKKVEEIPLTKSLKELSGGKSTVQNEIMSELQKEFGVTDKVPDRADELSLSDLGKALAPEWNGQLGKHSSSLVSKLFGAKMPAGFALSHAKALLKSEFGVEEQATDAIFLWSLTAEPASRLGSEDIAKNWLRDLSKNLFARKNIKIELEGQHQRKSSVVNVSAGDLAQINAKNVILAQQQMELYARYLGLNIHMHHGQLQEEKTKVLALQSELDFWTREHGEVYSIGIKGIFSPSKARQYDSFWNWARQDIVRLFYDITQGRLKNVDRDIAIKCLHVMNRSEPGLLEFIKYQQERLEKNPILLQSENYKLALRYGSELAENVQLFLGKPPVYKDITVLLRPLTIIDKDGKLSYQEIRREGINGFEAYVREMKGISKEKPILTLRSRNGLSFNVDKDKTSKYLKALEKMAQDGVSFEGKTVLLTGCGMGSIGSDVLRGLLSGGAKVLVTTSSFSRKTADYFRAIYEAHGARGSSLVVVPCNQASRSDVEKIVEWCYSDLEWDLDFLVPFAAISESGTDLLTIGSRSELAHRMMLTNLLVLMGSVAQQKERRGIDTRPAAVVLPLSPNHGDFGGDGLYGESKLALETLFNRWHSESWQDYLSIIGAVIG